jgi:hypothetical protein
MTASRPAPAYDDLGELIAFEAVERALDSARREVIRARACWANWAQRTTRAIEEADGPEAREIAWLQLRRVYSAASQAEDALDEACGQLPAGQCPGCGQTVLRRGGPGGRIYGTGGAPHTCPDHRAAR